MKLLIVIGAGASFDCWPRHVKDDSRSGEFFKLPLANDLFSPFGVQNGFLKKYNLMGLAGQLRQQKQTQGTEFDIEAELASINEKAKINSDFNQILNMFKARFYLHGLISTLASKTDDYTSLHTIYVDLLNKLKEWINESPKTRFVDIVSFNYDDLIEKAMDNVYGYDWSGKNTGNPLYAYYQDTNLKIFKPHGSINWARKVYKENEGDFKYVTVEDAFKNFNKLYIMDDFIFIDPNNFTNSAVKNYIPAVAVPFKEKNDFQECPEYMYTRMVNAVKDADKLITLGWKGADEHFTRLLKTENTKIDKVYVVSPKADTQLTSIYSPSIIELIESSFSYFVGETDALENLLATFDTV